MRILIAGQCRHEWHENAWARALKELGHDVSLFRIGAYFRSRFEKVQYRIKTGPLVRRINEDFLTEVNAVKPQFIISYTNYFLFPETVSQLKDAGRAILVCYNNDNPFGELSGRPFWRHFKKALKFYDLVLAYRPGDVQDYLDSGAQRVKLLQSHYLPWLHRPMSSKEKCLQTWDSDIGFFGHCENDKRLEYLTRLIRGLPGVRFKIHGSNWRKYGKGTPWQKWNTAEIQGEAYVAAINATKIALNFLSTINRDTYTRRCFEIPACGTLLLGERTDEMQSLYAEDKEAVYFSSAEELSEKAKFYLRNDGLRMKIAASGHERCLSSGYDVYSRMRQFLAFINNGTF